jgi:hypothetical protein
LLFSASRRNPVSKLNGSTNGSGATPEPAGETSALPPNLSSFWTLSVKLAIFAHFASRVGDQSILFGCQSTLIRDRAILIRHQTTLAAYRAISFSHNALLISNRTMLPAYQAMLLRDRVKLIGHQSILIAH